MTRFAPPLLALALAAVLLPPAARAEDVEIGREKGLWYPGDAARIEIDLSLGALTVEGSDGRDVEAELVLFCTREALERCRERARQIHLSPRASRSTLEVRLKNTPQGRLEGIRAELTVRVPRRFPLEIDQRGGDVTVGGMASDLEIDVAAGSVRVEASQAAVRRVSVKVAVGKADLWLEGSHVEGAGFPRSIAWTGSGTASIEVDLGSGDTVVDLR